MPGTDPEIETQEKARAVVLRALERRVHSRRELERILRRKQLDVEVCAPVLDRLTEVGLIDDVAFARAFVASRQQSRPRGRRALEQELGQRGVSREIAARVLDEAMDEEDPVEAARRAVASKLRSLSGRPPQEARRKAEQFLLRRGFSWGTVREALAADFPE